VDAGAGQAALARSLLVVAEEVAFREEPASLSGPACTCRATVSRRVKAVNTVLQVSA
jgi:hypothetical protein